jgi:hypothetical protein
VRHIAMDTDAASLSRHVPLATLNVKVFEDFAEYHGSS